jgi:hypothetical protein
MTVMLEESLYRPADEDLRYLILAWYRRARHAQIAHAAAAARARRFERLLGVPAVLFSTVVGTAVFATIGHSPERYLQIAAGVMSILAACLAALQTFLRLDDRSREHRTRSQAFGSLRRDLGQLGAVGGRLREDVEQELERVHERYDSLSQGSLDVPPRVWDKKREDSRLYWPEEFSAWPEHPGR